MAGDDRDEGVVDTWPLHLAAWPIQPAEDSDGTWQLTAGMAGGDWFQIAIRPLRERSYWISQRQEHPAAGALAPQTPVGPIERRLAVAVQVVKGSRMWLKSQVFWVMPEQVLLSTLPGQPPLSRWIAQIDRKFMLLAWAKLSMVVASGS